MCECEGIGPKMVKLGSKLRGMVNFTPLPFYSGGKKWFRHPLDSGGTRWRRWLRYCATSRKIAGSIPDGVTGIFH